MTDTPVQQIISALDKCKAKRRNYDDVYQTISEFVHVNRGDFTTKTTPGTRRDLRVHDTTAVQANQTLANVLHSGALTPGQKWISFAPENVDLQGDEEVQRWLSQASEIMHVVFNRPEYGFNAQMHTFFMDATSYGTSVIYINDEPGKGLIFQTIHLNEIYISCNYAGRTDTIYREFELTARQCEQKWPELAETSRNIKQALLTEPDKKFTIIHKVCPIRDAISMFGEAAVVLDEKKTIASIYILKEDEAVLNISGYYEMPYVVFRWYKLVGEEYGRSPAWNCLANIRRANVIANIQARTAQLQGAPTLLIPDDGVISNFKLEPNSLIVGGVDDNGNQRIIPLEVGGNLNDLEFILQSQREAIRQAFFVDRFAEREGVQPLTATETIDRQETGMRLIGPHLYRIEEALSEIVDRVFAILVRRKMIPPAPEVLQGENLRVVYTSPLAHTQKSVENLSYQKFLNTFAPFIQMNPNLLTNNFDLDSIIRDGAVNAGVNIRYLIPEQDAREARDDQAQAAEQEQQLMQASTLADGAAKLIKVSDKL